jgi:DNA invertase Pin-like site-specific DNA recombinase
MSKNTPSMRRVIGIVRVSTPGQVGEDKFGVARQRHDIEQARKTHDLEIVRILEVVESGSTAFKGEDFKQVFKDLARPDIDGAIVSAIDRLVRPGFLGDLQVFDHFQRNRKLIFTPSQVIDVESEAGWLVSGMFGLSAGLEKRAIAKRTRDAKERMRSVGKHPGGPLLLPRVGLAYSKTSGWSYTQDSARVLRGYDLLFQGMSYEDIAKLSGLGSTGRGVMVILRNSVWKAVRTYPPNSLRAVPLEVDMGIQPLISAERWAAAQKLMDQKRTRARARRKPRDPQDVSPVADLLRCACGRFHYLQRDPRAGQRDLFYCASRRPGPSCGAPTLRREEVEHAMERALTEYFANGKTLRSMLAAAQKGAAKPAVDTARIERELAERAADRERLIDLRVKNLITVEEFERRARKLETATRDLEAMRPKAEPVVDPKVMASAIAGLFAEFPYLTPPDQHALVHRVFTAFDVSPDGRAIAGAVIRGDMLAQAYMKNGTRWRPSSEIHVFPDLVITLPQPVVIPSVHRRRRRAA